MNRFLTIGAFAKSTNVPVSTLRYYERLGLLAPEGRSDGNYRVYGPYAHERLEFIQSAKEAGFTLEDIAVLLGISDGTTRACDEVRGIIDHRLTELDDRLKTLRRLKRTLTELQRTCRDSGDGEHCLVLEELAEPRGTRSRSGNP